MMLINLFGFGLVAAAIALAGYSVYCVCRARKSHKDPRPFALPVFSLLAFSALQFCWIYAGFAEKYGQTLAMSWIVIDTAMLASIAWLLHFATKYGD
jgi:hypothetical protein